jgi:hypothetical protein
MNENKSLHPYSPQLVLRISSSTGLIAEQIMSNQSGKQGIFLKKTDFQTMIFQRVRGFSLKKTINTIYNQRSFYTDDHTGSEMK